MQGFNMGRYVPPDLEGTTSGNRLNAKRAPGTLRKDGSQTVRFEMPFAVWCHTCKPHAIIGQGVRFNAEKRKIGYYYSTPIWSFRLKHVACGGWIEIKTDPKETKYVVVEGGKARDYGEGKDREGEDGRAILTPAERERRREDAFAVLEGKVEEKEAVEGNKKRIEELYRSRERDWEDPGDVNKRLRKSFRRDKKIYQREERAVESLKERIGTDMEILPEVEQDAQRAKLVAFEKGGNGPASASGSFFRTPSRTSISSRTPIPKSRNASGQKSETKKDALRRQLVNSTRAAMNPFGNEPGYSTKQTMGYHNTTRRNSSFHWTAEAYLAFGIGLARRVSRTERRYSYAERRSSHAERWSSKSKRTTTSSSSSSHHKNKPTKQYPCYHRIVTSHPEPSHQHHHHLQDQSFHNFCVASDATYARIAARLERLRGHGEDVAAYVRERGDRSDLRRVVEGLREEVGRLKGVLEGMRRVIEEGEDGWDASEKAFLVGGRWATFL